MCFRLIISVNKLDTLRFILDKVNEIYRLNLIQIRAKTKLYDRYEVRLESVFTVKFKMTIGAKFKTI